MAILFYEGVPSRESKENPREIVKHYILSGTNDDVFARAYAKACTDVTYDGLFRQDVKLTPKGEYIWYVEVPYGPIKPREDGDYQWNFDTTGGTCHIMESLETTGRYIPDGGTLEDYKGAIGVNDDCDVQGCTIVEPRFKWTETHTFLAASLNFNYALTLKDLTGATNLNWFRGFGLQEVLFMGATGGPSNKNPKFIDIQYSFEVQESIGGIDIGDITVVNKQGWHYLWTRFSITDGEKKRVVKPVQVNCERVYPAKDFSLLGIGI